MAAYPKWRERFLEALAEEPNVTRAAKLAKSDKRHMYRRRERDPEFAREWDEALSKAWDRLEGECYKRATDGWEEPVFYQGEQVGTVKRFSDTMAALLLRAHRPEVYKPESAVNINAQVEGKLYVAVDPEDL
jgi:hypothetical protein